MPFNCSSEKTVLPITLISRTKTRKAGNGSPLGASGAGGKSVPGEGVGCFSSSGRDGASPERPVGSGRRGRGSAGACAPADEIREKNRNSVKDQNNWLPRCKIAFT